MKADPHVAGAALLARWRSMLGTSVWPAQARSPGARHLVPTAPARASRRGSTRRHPYRGYGVRRVQATAGRRRAASPAVTDRTPAEPVPPTSRRRARRQRDRPDRPAAEREGGGGEPTEVAAEEEAEEPEPTRPSS